jgi:ATP-dependent Lon protease
MEKTIPNTNANSFLPVLPLKNMVALPKSIIPIIVGRDFSIKAVNYALKGNKEVFITAQKKENIDKPTEQDIFTYGTRATILQVAKMQNGSLKILIEGLSRAKIVECIKTDEFIGAVTKDCHSVYPSSPQEHTALWRNLSSLFREYISVNDKISKDILATFKNNEDLNLLADTVAIQLPLSFDTRQKLLEMLDIKARCIMLGAIIKDEIEIIKTEGNIRKRVQSQVEKNQKDYYLNEQMRAIQQELGREDYQQEIDELRKKAKQKKLPKEPLEKVLAECKRLDQMQPTSPEAAVSRNYIDWLINVPWQKVTKDNISLEDAEKMLDASHAGMKKPKERVLEFIATKKFAGDKLKKSPIICLAGPPGTGKTSLGISIANALGRKFTRISLGGMRDEAEIRGHRRTYIGAMPGKILQAMKKVGVTNPVILLDEIDKMSADFRGDPASALLEVLDPEQNNTFADYFMEVDYDLSKVMFITTANVYDAIPYALLDRMEIIHLSGYTTKEKVQIAQEHILPKVIKEHALRKTSVKFSAEILDDIVEHYTKEAGVRLLEQTLSKILRKSIQLMQQPKGPKTVEITKERVLTWLGPEKFKDPKTNKSDEIGLANGLAWTEVGGDTLEIEVIVLKGKGSLSLTGQLGEVMQESAQAALSYIRSRAKEFGLKESFYSDVDIHVHLPEGAIPKDGPSAGITLVTALVSALTKNPIRNDIAMTGEVTLRGRVLPVGGLKEKLLAAVRLGLSKVIVPAENKNDILEFEKELENKIEIVYAENMETVLKEAFVKSPFKAIKKRIAKKKITKK